MYRYRQVQYRTGTVLTVRTVLAKLEILWLPNSRYWYIDESKRICYKTLKIIININNSLPKLYQHDIKVKNKRQTISTSYNCKLTHTPPEGCEASGSVPTRKPRVGTLWTVEPPALLGGETEVKNRFTKMKLSGTQK
jgi:hypothetical protein